VAGAVPAAIEAEAPGILPKLTGLLPNPANLLKSSVHHLKESGLFHDLITDAVLWAVPHQAAAAGHYQLLVKADALRRLALVHKEIEETTRPALLAILQVALQDMFDVTVPISAIDPKAGGGGLGKGMPEYGNVLADALFGALLKDDQTGPNAGLDNLRTMLNTVTKTSFAAWIGDLVHLGFLNESLPEAAKLHEAIEKGIGLSRLAAFALRPLIVALVGNPLTKQMNARFRPTKPTPSELVRLLNAGEILSDEYNNVMAEAGYSLAWTQKLRAIHSTQLDQSEVKKAHEIGEWTDEQATAYLLHKGFNDADAGLIIRTWKRDTVGKPFERLVSIARDMFIEHELDEDGLRNTLQIAGLKGETVEQWVNVSQIERSRPRLLTESDAEQAYIQNIWTADQLTGFYLNRRYSQEHAAVLVSLATMKKVTFERNEKKLAGELPPAPVDAVRESTANEAFRRGLIDEPSYLQDLARLGITGPRLDAQLAVSRAAREQYADDVKKKKQTNEGVHVSAGSAEDLFVRGGIDETSLHAFYTTRGFTESEWPTYLRLQMARRAEFLAKILKQQEKGHTTGTFPAAV
jgi:hypothetical protein